MSIREINEMLREEARRLDDAAGVYTQEAIVLREAAAKLEELQHRKCRGGPKDVCTNENYWI